MTKNKPWTEEDRLRWMYHGQNMTDKEIADKLGCTRKTISYYRKKYGIETTPQSCYGNPPSLSLSTNGYETFRVQVDGETLQPKHHRLLGVLLFGFDAIKGMEVHHKNGLGWDNRPNNFELMTTEEHAEHHVAERTFDEQGNFA